MTKHEKELLLSKAEALRWSYADPQLQSIMGLIQDVIRQLPTDNKETLGFTLNQGENNQ